MAEALKVLVCDDSARTAEALESFSRRLGFELGIPMGM